MKKPTHSKLSLATETLRTLSSAELAAVAGGGGIAASKIESCRAPASKVSSCHPICTESLVV